MRRRPCRAGRFFGGGGLGALCRELRQRGVALEEAEEAAKLYWISEFLQP